MKRFVCIYFLCLVIALSTNAQLPMKFDNQYKTIFAKDLCKMALQKPDFVLLDVRSAGEYSDTSQYNSLNMGHLKGAININIDTLVKNIELANPYKNKTLVIYCSHSQRSRRVSKLFAENGFTDFYNLNGGMSQINQLTEKEFPCKKDWIVSNLKYSNLSTNEAIDLVKTNSNLIILDIRPAAMFNSTDSLAQNNIGRIKKAINIPYAELKQRINELSNFKDGPILVYSESGDGDAARAAVELINNHFTKVYHLLAGLNAMLTSNEGVSIIENPVPFRMLDAQGVLSQLKQNPGLVIYDTRPAAEFENKVTGHDSYKNIGSLKNAYNLEEKNFETYKYPLDKEKPILIYGHGEAYKLAGSLCAKGYKNVNLSNGLYNIIWSAYNIENAKEAMPFLVNHEGLY